MLLAELLDIWNGVRDLVTPAGGRQSGMVGNPASQPPQLSLADVAERLFLEFEPRLPQTTTVVTAVRRCRRELEILGSPQSPDVLQGLALGRLQSLIVTGGPKTSVAN